MTGLMARSISIPTARFDRKDLDRPLSTMISAERAPRHVVKICRAEACQARGRVAIEAAMTERLGIAMGARGRTER